MTTFLYSTTSNTAADSNVEAVWELVQSDEYWFTVEPDVDRDASTIRFFADAEPSAFDVHPEPDAHTSVAEAFFKELSVYLEGKFEVKCVEVQGTGEITAWTWVVSPDGGVVHVNC